ncbi:MAG: 16S rRNA processing protein RimM [Hellea sp.]|jgi:16S rRNA processing protein RimM|nr:ribosome maturation factor RimM [Hellea sp.]MBT4355964.1 16S rRNA processing protein RimM [Rhodospirillaceae bacterium]MBT3594070.1 16S rRNA processing protein RimM [Hellea sp.]MBT4995147.1 16S rRNA processing protein RimM [Hellea sp.]MBT5835867.1 16S rRNA processing protein RimM [Hellea sp.]MBT7398015.1 16S rRNA processing protein RimM [Hellea sp.]
MKQDKYICIAAVAGAFGVKGEIKLKTFTDKPESIMSYGSLLSIDGEILLTPQSYKSLKGGLALMCKEIVTRDQAEALKSTKLYVKRNCLPKTEEDEFYLIDLIGMEVKTVDGKRMGSVVGTEDFGAGVLLEIKPKDSVSFYQPFTKDAVPKIDIHLKRIVININSN